MDEKKQIILIVATAWGPKQGGINSFNKDFCIELAKYSGNIKVICIVSNCTESEVLDAEKNKVDLLSIGLIELDSFIEAKKEKGRILKAIYDKYDDPDFHKKIDYVVLHDIATGDIIQLKGNLFTNASWIIFHHMHYQEYMDIESYEQNSSKYDKIITQYILFQKADYIFTIGPLLKELLTDFLTSKKVEKNKIENIHELIPGLKKNDDSKDYKVKIDGLVFGRLDKNHDKLKLSSLVLNAWTDIIPGKKTVKENLKKAKLKVIGFDFNDEADKKQLIELQKKFSDCVLPLPFINDQKTLNYSLGDSTIAFMLSRHEGFGLTGWEAIGAKVPLVLSKNTGLYKLLEKEGLTHLVKALVLNEHYVEENGKAFNSEELTVTKEAIEEYLDKTDECHANANNLFEQLNIKYTWSSCIQKFLAEIRITTNTILEEKKHNTNEKNEVSSNTTREFSLSDFAQECVENHHALILSHRTNIIEMKDAETYRLFRPFLNRFAFEKNIIRAKNSGLNRTLLVFVLDFGGDYRESFDEQALYNCLTLQSTLKAICLVPPFGSKKALHGENVSSEIIKYHIKPISLEMNEQEYVAHDLLLNGLSNRTVILVKNYKNYIEGLENLYEKISEDINQYKVAKLISNGIKLIPRETDDIPAISLDADYVLMNYIPFLGGLSNEYKEEVEKECTNIRKATDKAFGLYATVRFDNYNDSKLEQAQVYSINRETQECKQLPLSDSAYLRGKKTLYREQIENSMKYISMSAAYFLERLCWKNEIRTKYWSDYEQRNNEFAGAYYALEKLGFHHLSLFQFLNIPILFPDIIEEIRKK